MPVILDHPRSRARLSSASAFLAIDKPRPRVYETPLILDVPRGRPMHAVVLTIHLLLALALILVVLLQRSEGGGLGIGGGGGGIMTSRGAATALSKLTWAIGIAFVVTSLTLTILAARGSSASGSVIDRVGTDAAPDAAGAGSRARGRPAAADAGAATDRRRRPRCE